MLKNYIVNKSKNTLTTALNKTNNLIAETVKSEFMSKIIFNCSHDLFTIHSFIYIANKLSNGALNSYITLTGMDRMKNTLLLGTDKIIKLKHNTILRVKCERIYLREDYSIEPCDTITFTFVGNYCKIYLRWFDRMAKKMQDKEIEKKSFIGCI